jgi:hypothetical protein
VRPLFCPYLGQELVDHLRRVNPYEAAEEAVPLDDRSLASWWGLD